MPNNLVCGGRHSLAIDGDKLQVWGADAEGQLGLGDYTGDKYRPVLLGSNWQTVAAGNNHSLAIKRDGTLWAWGDHQYGALGLGTDEEGDYIDSNVPKEVERGTTWQAIAAGEVHSLAIKRDGTLWTWGTSTKGVLGHGDDEPRDKPAQINTPSDLRKWKAVAAGIDGYHSLGIKEDGSLWAWGNNSNGQLGYTVIDDSNLSPHQVGTGRNWVAVAAGTDHSLGLKSDGSLWAWGYYEQGQLGYTVSEDSNLSPNQVGPDTNWVAVAAGANHSLGLKSDGSLWVWGQNDQGQLGLKDTTIRKYPEKVIVKKNNLDVRWVCVSGGYHHSLAIGYTTVDAINDYLVWGWGLNSNGQVGHQGGADNYLSPVEILSMSVAASGVDLYIKDNENDDGVVPSAEVCWHSPDITLSSDKAGNYKIECPEYDTINFVHVKVRNRGTRAAQNAKVKLYWTNPGTNLSKPFWHTDGLTVDGTPGNLRKVNVPARSDNTTATFEWLPPNPNKKDKEPGHFCLVATVHHDDDPLIHEDVEWVRWENNLAWKNVNVIPMVERSSSSMGFRFSGQQGASSQSDLHIDRRGLPATGKVKLKIPTRFLNGSQVSNLLKVSESEGGQVCQVEVTSEDTADIRGIWLRPGENNKLTLEVYLPPGVQHGNTYPVFVEQKVNGTVTGRVTLVARTAGTPGYIANRRSQEIHVPNCQWVAQMGLRSKVPYDDLELALKRGYNGCRFCLPEKDKG